MLRELNLDVAAEYLVMAATLAWIKSRMLLPPDDEAEEEGRDPRAELVARLLEYQRFKEAADALGARPLLGRDVFAAAGAAVEAPPEAEREIEVGLLELVEALRRVLREAKTADAHPRGRRRADHRARAHGAGDRRARARRSGRAGGAAARTEGAAPTRAIIVATFLAILELAKIAALRIFQSLDEAGAPEGPIRLRRAGDPSTARAEIA